MAYYATINELIQSINTTEISYRNLHTNVYINNSGQIVKIPYKSIIREYLPFFKSAVVPADFTASEIATYRYKPKKLSYDLYGTTELWSALLELNNMYSTIDFTLEKQINIFEPRAFKKLLNEVMILEKVIS